MTVLSLADFARDVGIPYGTARRWKGEGLPHKSTATGLVRVTVDEARKWIAAHRSTSVSFDRCSDVYFAVSEAGPIKIGWSVDPDRRVAGRIVAKFGGGKHAKRAVHTRFAHGRLDGEWFSPAEDLLQYIADLRDRKAILPPPALLPRHEMALRAIADIAPACFAPRDTMLRACDGIETTGLARVVDDRVYPSYRLTKAGAAWLAAHAAFYATGGDS